MIRRFEEKEPILEYVTIAPLLQNELVEAPTCPFSILRAGVLSQYCHQQAHLCDRKEDGGFV